MPVTVTNVDYERHTSRLVVEHDAVMTELANSQAGGQPHYARLAEEAMDRLCDLGSLFTSGL